MTEPVPTDVAPVLDIALSDAVQELTGFEVLTIERRSGKPLEDMGAIAVTIGAVFTYENRDGKKRSWASVENMTLKQLNAYFAAEPDDVDESEPDSVVGKGDSPDA